MENSNNEQATNLTGPLDIQRRLQGSLRQFDLAVEVVKGRPA